MFFNHFVTKGLAQPYCSAIPLAIHKLIHSFCGKLFYPQAAFFLQCCHNTPMPAVNILKIAIPSPVFGLFEYTSKLADNIQVGCRVRVSFGRQRLIGIVMQISSSSDYPIEKLKAIESCLDAQPILPAELLTLLKWAADYYQYPLGDVVSTALPKLLRQGEVAEVRGETVWQINTTLADEAASRLKRAPKQLALFNTLLEHGTMNAEQMNALRENWRPAMNELLKKQLVSANEQSCLAPVSTQKAIAKTLNHEQQQVVQTVSEALHEFKVFLLQGITGSGKTEVYLQLAEAQLQQGKQVLILVPEISLTPQLTRRFEQYLAVPIAALHSALNDKQRLCAWLMATDGSAQVVIGTRSALFTPMPKLGMIIIDEEHDGSFKQQDSFRYHARDLALVRARNASIPVVLGSATPSLESLFLAHSGRYQHLRLTQRAASQARPPKIHLLDVCQRPMQDGLSDTLIEHIKKHLAADGQVMLFLNRRGYAPLLMCHDCGWSTDCPRCDAHMTVHHHNRQLRCHHCGHERPAPSTCPECNSETLHIPGAGTERIEVALTQLFPHTNISRIDRDTTRRKGELHSKLEQAQNGESQILIGTQMLAKGHDFPNLTLVALLDTDQGLFSSDFRGAEHMAQLIVQVAGRAGRAQKAGEVFIQTHHPQHPLLQTLLHEGYDGFARAALVERQQAMFPPYAHMAILRTEASNRQQCMDFLQQALQQFQQQNPSVDFFGPLPAPMERRAGRYRAQLILQSDNRKALYSLLKANGRQLSKLPSALRVRWSLDVDPQDMH